MKQIIYVLFVGRQINIDRTHALGGYVRSMMCNTAYICNTELLSKCHIFMI